MSKLSEEESSSDLCKQADTTLPGDFGCLLWSRFAGSDSESCVPLVLCEICVQQENAINPIFQNDTFLNDRDHMPCLRASPGITLQCTCPSSSAPTARLCFLAYIFLSVVLAP